MSIAISVKKRYHTFRKTEEKRFVRGCTEVVKHIWKRSKLICYIGLLMVVLILNVVSWRSTAFCDAYIAWIFPIWVNTFGRLAGLFPFSVGEWLLVAGVVLVVLAAVHLVSLLLVMLFAGIKKRKSVENYGREQQGFVQKWRKWCKSFLSFFAWIVLMECLVMTLNCTILYHGSSLADRCFEPREQPYTLEELVQVRNLVVERCNELSLLVPRDENGDIVYAGSVDAQGRSLDLEDQSIRVMKQLGQTYPQFDGYYPRPKPMMFSDLMCQQYMQGYYFSFSLEANYNDVMCFINKPATLCHELVHLRGYLFEDEANFLSYVACVESDDLVFQYSGYLSVLYYLDNDFYAAVGRDYEIYSRQPMILQQVHEDNTFVPEEEWARINKEALIDTEVVEAVADTFVDTTLKLNGVKDGKISYSRVVELLLRYHLQ